MSSAKLVPNLHFSTHQRSRQLSTLECLSTALESKESEDFILLSVCLQEMITINANYGICASVASASAGPDTLKVARALKGRIKLGNVIIGRNKSLGEKERKRPHCAGEVERNLHGNYLCGIVEVSDELAMRRR